MQIFTNLLKFYPILMIIIQIIKKNPMYILLVYERESVEKWLSKTSTNNNYKKHQKVNKKIKKTI